MPGQCSVSRVFMFSVPQQMNSIVCTVLLISCLLWFSYLQYYQYNNMLVLLSIMLIHFHRFPFRTRLNMLFINNLVAPKNWEKSWCCEITRPRLRRRWRLLINSQHKVQSSLWPDGGARWKVKSPKVSEFIQRGLELPFVIVPKHMKRHLRHFTPNH